MSRRGAPEFYESGADIPSGPHAEAIHYALSDLGLAGVFCIEGVPTIGFLNEPNAPLNRIDELHRILWNQGIMSLLLIIRSDELIAYSLAQRPFRREQGTASDPRLISTMSLVVDALKLRELIDSAESGRFWFEHDAFFDPENRVDHVLLSNLLQSFRDMREDLGGDAAQALLMQTMFISYLEDRQIITADVFLSVSNNAYTSLAQIFEARSPQAFESLFVWLKKAFNGNLFNAPCAFEPSDQKPPKLSVEHFSLLARFRRGREEMTSGQLRLWGYDFRYMPVGLISAVYDRFLKEESEKKNADGAFYTPMFLADVVVNQLWDDLTEEQRLDGIYCDPACGSGIFLVRLFQRLVAYHCRTRNKQRASWNDLKAIARRLHGGDINPSAVRVAAFSLYIALLEQSNPPDLPALIKAGKLLPSLYGDTLHPAEDFFATKDGPHYDAVVGNPPWKGRSGQVTTAQTWAKRQGYPDPAKEIAWGFIWKALRVIKPGGLVALLLPAMGILHNTARESQTARRRLLQEAKVRRIINFSDLCFQLFDGAQRPTAFALYGHADGEKAVYRFEYWVPKADLNLRLKRTMTLSCADRLHFRSDFVSEDPTIFKRRLWTRSPDEKLIQYLRTMPPLSAFINEYKDVRKNGFDREREWVIGQGFQPAQESRLSDKNYQTTSSAVVALHPYFDANKFKAVALPTIKSLPWHTVTVRRAGFAGGFSGPHILIPQGVERSMGRARAAYTDQSVVFEHSIQAISFPATAKRTAKLLTAVLNSSLAAWVYFHDTANFGTDRAKIHQSDLLRLPFDIPNNMPNPEIAGIVAGKIVRLIDREIKRADDIFQPQDDVLAEIDALVFSYYGLSDDDIAIVVDTFRYIIPSMQPRRSSGLQPIWANSLSGDRCAYAAALCKALKPWFRQPVSASLSAVSADIAVLKLTVDVNVQEYVENKSTDFNHFLFEMHKNLPITLPGNVQLVPDLRFVVGHDLYLVKPMQLRHWLRSTALADAEQIAAELSAALARQIKDPSHARG